MRRSRQIRRLSLLFIIPESIVFSREKKSVSSMCSARSLTDPGHEKAVPFYFEHCTPACLLCPALGLLCDGNQNAWRDKKEELGLLGRMRKCTASDGISPKVLELRSDDEEGVVLSSRRSVQNNDSSETLENQMKTIT
jgi:hypothetical protein